MDVHSTVSGANKAWLLVSTALVLLMTPALSLLYGGLVRVQNALNTMMMSFAVFAVAGISWVVAGYSLTFGGDGRWVGNLDRVLLIGVGLDPMGTVPHLLFMAFQGTFVVITAALLYSGLATAVLLRAVMAVVPLRAGEREEKVWLDIAVSNHFVDPTIEAIVNATRTGEVGDGKIFVPPVERVVRIRTGEVDTAAVTPERTVAANRA